MGPIIDITNLFPYRIIILFAYSFAFYNIIHSILKDKYNSFITLFAIFAARIITSIAFFNKEPFDALGYPAFLILLFIITYFLTVGNTAIKLIPLVFGFLSQILSALVNGFFQAIIYQNKDRTEIFGSDNPNLYHLYVFLSINIIIVAVSFLFSGILKVFDSKKRKLQSKKIYAYISFLPFSHIFIIVFSMLLAPEDYSNQRTYSTATSLIVYIMMGIILLFDCSFPFIIDYFEKTKYKNLQNEKELMKNKLDYQQMIMLKEEKQKFRKLKHDYANIISTAKGFIEINKPEKALALFQNISSDLSGLTGFSICSNETINTIIYTKQQQAENNNIHMTVNINETNGVLINDYDLCRILCNIIDNALNAISISDNKEICHFDIEINKEQIIIKSKNNFDAKKQNIKVKSELHGNGIGIIKELASKYNGNYTAQQSNGIWYTETSLKNIKLADKATPPPNLGLNF